MKLYYLRTRGDGILTFDNVLLYCSSKEALEFLIQSVRNHVDPSIKYKDIEIVDNDTNKVVGIIKGEKIWGNSDSTKTKGSS